MAAIPFLCRGLGNSFYLNTIEMWAWLYICQFSIFLFVKKNICICKNRPGCCSYSFLAKTMLCHSPQCCYYLFNVSCWSIYSYCNLIIPLWSNNSLILVNWDPFFSICPPPKLLPVMGPLERYITQTLDVALLCSSRAGSDLGQTSDRFEELCQLGFLISK